MTARTVKVGLASTTTIVAVAIAGGVIWAQGTVQPAAAAGSLAALTEEVRQLRLTLTDSARNQTQIQAMTVYLSAQQSRLGQVSARLDKAHADVLAASAEAQGVNDRFREFQAAAAKVTDPVERAGLAEMTTAMKTQRDAAIDRENQARARENEQLIAFQTEEARWLDLIGRLEALVRK